MSASNSEYFDSYDEISVHELMLKDAPRVKAYKNFIENNLPLFLDKIVLDVGSGTGVLSLLAARAGARHVYAIEAANNIAKLSEEIIQRNGYKDRITVIASAVEDVHQLPNGEMADVIISEWMGFYLLHESMIDAVITARDKFLKPNGIILPSTGTLYVCPVALKDYVRERFDSWKNLYGFDFSLIGSAARSNCLAKPEIMTISPNSLLSQPQQVISVDMKYVDSDDVKSILASMEFVIERNDVMHGFALWFDVSFEGVHSVVLNTSPSSDETHWHQTVALLPDALLVNRSSQLSCTVRLEHQHRRYNIIIDLLDEEASDSEDDAGMDTDENKFTNCSTELQDMISSQMKPVV